MGLARRAAFALHSAAAAAVVVVVVVVVVGIPDSGFELEPIVNTVDVCSAHAVVDRRSSIWRQAFLHMGTPPAPSLIPKACYSVLMGPPGKAYRSASG